MSLSPEARQITAADAIRALNDAAYAAAKAARKANDPRAGEFRRIALETDRLMDGGAV